MHPLSIFPYLLNFTLVAPLLLRLALGVLRLFAGLEKYKEKKMLTAILTVVSSGLLIIGLYTQLAVLVAIALIKYDYLMAKKAGKLNREKTALTVLMVIILLSLLFTGPGFLAFDLPL